MALILPDRHPAAGTLPQMAKRAATSAVRVGILNIMPKLEAYEPSLLGPLSRVSRTIEPVFLRLESHGYGSSDQEHLARFYNTFSSVRAQGLDGLILTGAPVEELPFKDVRYWSELSSILEFARLHIPSTLGLCWGGMALGGYLGLEKILFPRKLFGVFENRVLPHNHPILEAPWGKFPCAHSRHSGLRDESLEAAQSDGLLRLLSYGKDTGYSLFETLDHRFVAHQGHPEYVASRLVFEWERDATLGRPDVDTPKNFDTAYPDTTWHAHRESLFERWTSWIAAD